MSDESEDEVLDLTSPENVPGYVSPESMERMLEEIAEYEVELASDPTLPHLGNRYLQESLASCRQYLNRCQHYLQLTRRYEKNLRSAMRLEEMNIELRTAELLADDDIVRQGPSIEDRKSLATMQLQREHRNVIKLKRAHLNALETVKIVKLKYDDLNRTNADIKLQRQIVRDDRDAWVSGEQGSEPVGEGRASSARGLAPPVRPKLDPKDLLDDERRPDDLPKPKDMGEAEQMAAFFNRQPPRQEQAEQAEEPDEEPPAAPPPAATPSVSYDDLLSD